MHLLKLNTVWWNMQQIYSRENFELTKKLELERENLTQELLSVEVCQVYGSTLKNEGWNWQLSTDWGKTDNNLYENIQVAVRDEAICFEKSCNLKNQKALGFHEQ